MRAAGILGLAYLVAGGCGGSSSVGGDAAAEAGADSGVPDTVAEAGADAAVDAPLCIDPQWPPPGACAQDRLEVFSGAYQVVINRLEIGSNGVGFDLDNDDCDGDMTTGVNNVLWPLSALANQPIAESMADGDISLPLEFYDLDDVVDDDCVNFAIYFGRFPPDRDEDGEKAGGPVNRPGKDCNDHDPAINRHVAEVPFNGVDDDCNGLADEDPATLTPSDDTTDADGDGQTIADGDCDDRPGVGATIRLGAAEICGDGLDNDCNGRADDGCMAWSEGQSFPVESAALTADNEGVITFRGARVKNGVLEAGPSVFSVAIAVDKDATLDLNLTHVFIRGELARDDKGLRLSNGLLGGVLSARAMDQAPNLIAQLGGGFGTEDDSLLDAVLGPAGIVLALPTDSQGNHIPDVDVDGDGIEKFLDTDMDGDKENFRVDTCIDGDGTVVKDKVDPATGQVTEPCTTAKDAQGNYRFVDGWSISLKLDAVPAKLEGIYQTAAP